MELCGEIVRHKAFGRGQIVGFDNHYVTVLFDEIQTEKKFTYPAVFGPYLELENNSFLKQIEEDKNIIAEKEAEIKRIKEERVQAEIDAKTQDGRGKNATGTVGKSSDKNNIAFKCNYCDGGESKEVVGYRGVCSDETIKFNIKTAKHIWCSQPDTMCCQYLNGEISRAELCEFYERTKSEFSESVCYESQMLEIWTAGAGITQKGYKKGKPMTLRNVKANSLSLLTSKLPYAEDKERFIFAVFLINENYEGDTRETGHVGANPKYRLQLSLDEARELKFWDYYFNENKPKKIIFGSGLHRYLTDIQSAQVLKKICEIKQGTTEETLAKEFLEYYCRTKKVDIDSLPIPNGALQRMMRLCPACGSMDTVEIRIE